MKTELSPLLDFKLDTKQFGSSFSSALALQRTTALGKCIYLRIRQHFLPCMFRQTMQYVMGIPRTIMSGRKVENDRKCGR